MTFRAGFVIARKDMAKAAGEVKADVTPAGRTLCFRHKDPYATLRDDYGLMMAYLGENRLAPGGPSWELYLNDPSTTPEPDLLTECCLALA